MNLKNIVRQRIINDIFRSVKKKKEWKILVTDKLAMRIISSCCTVYEIVQEGVTLFEDLLKTREPLRFMEAIYFITPTEPSIRLLIQDYSDTPLYRSAHVFFTHSCPDELFAELAKSVCANYIKTLKELNISFIPYESQVFSLDMSEALKFHFNPEKQCCREDNANLERIAEQIATVCATTGEYPSIRYRIGFDRNFKLAQLVQKKLDAFKADDPMMGVGSEKLRSQLIILDRGFDCVSPLVHEFTFQAMAYDLLPIENDVYKQIIGERENDVLLNENEIWCELRHKHLSEILHINQKRLQECKEKETTRDKHLREMSEMVKSIDDYRNKRGRHVTHFSLASDCFQRINEIKNVWLVEQDFATGTDFNGDKVKDPLFKLVPVLLDESITVFEKIRLLLLYILSMNGVSEGYLAKLIERAQISEENKCIITNMVHLGPCIISNVGRKKMYQLPRKERNEIFLQTSRWIPVVKDIIEDAIDDKLDKKHFPYLKGRVALSVGKQAPASKRYRHNNNKNSPRVIIFIIGGMTYSEMRCCYEVTKDAKDWEVLIGSDHILTPNGFLNELRDLSCNTSTSMQEIGNNV